MQVEVCVEMGRRRERQNVMQPLGLKVAHQLCMMSILARVAQTSINSRDCSRRQLKTTPPGSSRAVYHYQMPTNAQFTRRQHNCDFDINKSNSASKFG